MISIHACCTFQFLMDVFGLGFDSAVPSYRRPIEMERGYRNRNGEMGALLFKCGI